MKELIVAYGVKNIYSKYNNYGDYTKIIIPATVDKISDAFNNLTYLEEVFFESYIDKDGKIVGVTSISNSFNNCRYLSSITFQNLDGVKIEDSFNKPKTLKKVY